jgi:hypothetical protein
MPKSKKELDRTDNIEWNGDYGASQELDPTPLPGSADHHEHVRPGVRHIGGVYDGHKDTSGHEPRRRLYR